MEAVNNKGQGKIRVLIGIPAAILALVALVVLVRGCVQTNREINALLVTAEEFQRLDKFEEALKKVDEALEKRPEDREIRTRRLEVSTFWIAAQYDQVNRVKNKQVLRLLDDNCRQLINEVGENARIRALYGIIQDLNDRPTEAINYYQRASDLDSEYSNVYNYWGYTIAKWELGGKDWAANALEKFPIAIKMNPDYVWPHINTAFVYLKQENPEGAKEGLEAAIKLAPENPRLRMLWGHYYLQRGERLKSEDLPEAEQNFHEAVKHFQEAKRQNPQIADLRVDLGIAFEKVHREQDAAHEYEEATKLDSWNIQACVRFAQLLSKQGKHAIARKEFQRCQELVSEALSDFETRMRETNDTSAREWLSRQMSNTQQEFEKAIENFEHSE